MSMALVPLQSRVQPLETALPALLHAAQHGCGLGTLAARGGVQHELGLAALCGEAHIDHALEALDSVLVVGRAHNDEVFGRHDLAVDATHPVVLALRGAHAQPENPARPGIDLAGMHAEIRRAEPVRKLLGLGPRGEHSLARRVEDARDSKSALVHFSVRLLRLARPASKSLPIIRSMLKKRPMSFETYGAGPYITQVTCVPSSFGCSVNSATLWASNGLMKSSLIATLDGGEASAISMRP